MNVGFSNVMNCWLLKAFHSMAGQKFMLFVQLVFTA